MLTTAEKYEYLTAALDHCGRFLLDAPNEEIEYRLFEEFDGDARAFLCAANLAELTAAGFISPEVASLASELLERFIRMESTEQWHAQAVKNAPEWLAILTLADRIKADMQKNSSY